MGIPGPEVLALPCASPAGDCSSLRPGHLFAKGTKGKAGPLSGAAAEAQRCAARGLRLALLGQSPQQTAGRRHVLIFADTGLRSQGTGLRASSTPPPPGPPPHHSGASPERHPRLGAFGAAAAALGGRSGARESKVTLLPSTAGSGLFDAGIQRKSEVEG